MRFWIVGVCWLAACAPFGDLQGGSQGRGAQGTQARHIQAAGSHDGTAGREGHAGSLSPSELSLAQVRATVGDSGSCTQWLGHGQIIFAAIGSCSGISNAKLAEVTAANRARAKMSEMARAYSGQLPLALWAHAHRPVVSDEIMKVPGPGPSSAPRYLDARWPQWLQESGYEPVQTIRDGDTTLALIRSTLAQMQTHGELAKPNRMRLGDPLAAATQVAGPLLAQLRARADDKAEFAACELAREPPLPDPSSGKPPLATTTAAPTAQDTAVLTGSWKKACITAPDADGRVSLYVRPYDKATDFWAQQYFHSISFDYLDAVEAVFKKHGVAMQPVCQPHCPLQLLFGSKFPVTRIVAGKRAGEHYEVWRADLDQALAHGDLASGYLGVADGLAKEKQWRAEIVRAAQAPAAHGDDAKTLEPCAR